MKKRPLLPVEVPILHARPDRSQSRLRDIVSIHVDVMNNDTYFDVYLSRVPGLGEEITYGPREYQVIRVIHMPVDNDGRPGIGSHAYVDANILPEEPHIPRQRRKRRRPADGP